MPLAEDTGLRTAQAVAPVLAHAADTVGTPAYVVDATSLQWAAEQMLAAFPAPWIVQYSLKANDLPAIVAALHGRGIGANVVSSGEWALAAAAGVPPSEVTFEGIGKTDAQLEDAVRAAAAGTPPRWLAVESAAETAALAAIAERYDLGASGRPRLDILVRLNPQVQPETQAQFAVGHEASKFGMATAEILALVRSGAIGGGLRLRGIHVHAGSDLRDVGAWADAGVRAVRLLGGVRATVAGGDELNTVAGGDELNTVAGGDRGMDTVRDTVDSNTVDSNTVDTVDFGGGFPIAGPGSPTPEAFAAALAAQLAAAGLDLPRRHAIEPGRYFVGGAGFLVARVLHSRRRPPYAQQVVIDAGMTELIRPALYGSRHPVHALRAAENTAEPDVDTAVEGPVCESTDSFGIHRLPRLHRGDLVALADAGAYGASFSSRYNGRAAPVEVIITEAGDLTRCTRPDTVMPGTLRASSSQHIPPPASTPPASTPPESAPAASAGLGAPVRRSAAP